MIFIAFLLTKILAQSLTSCSCSQLQLNSECLNAGCEWIKHNQDFQCISKSLINQPICQDINNHLNCNSVKGCAWNNKRKCEQFTKCQDYVIDQYDKSNSCYLKDHSCINGLLNNQGQIICQSIDEYCKDLKNIQQKNQNFLNILNVQIKDNINQICMAHVFYDCSIIKNEDICNQIYLYNQIECQWENEMCIQTLNQQHLNEQTCFLNTRGTHSWQYNKCQKCNDSNNNQRILLETKNTPTFTQYSNITKQINTYELINQSQVINCTNQVIVNSTYICYTQECKLKKIETLKNICKTYSGINLDNLENESTTINQCSTNQNSTILSNGYNYTDNYLITECLSTTQTFVYSNGIKKGIQTNSIEQKTICQKNELMISLTIGNSIQKCEQNITQTKGFNTEYIEKCNTIVQEQILPDTIDPSKPFSNITKTDQCSRLYQQKTQIDIGIVTLSENSQNIGKAKKTLTQISLDNTLFQLLCQSNYSSDVQTLNKSDIQILNHTQQFQKIATNKNVLEQCTNQQDIQPATQMVSFKIENEAWIEETIIFDEEVEKMKQLELEKEIQRQKEEEERKKKEEEERKKKEEEERKKKEEEERKKKEEEERKKMEEEEERKKKIEEARKQKEEEERQQKLEEEGKKLYEEEQETKYKEELEQMKKEEEEIAKTEQINEQITFNILQELFQNNLEKCIDHVSVIPYSNGLILQAWIILYFTINQ